MATIAGASQYRGAATLANSKGAAPSVPTILDGGAQDVMSILDSGRQFAVLKGISSSARALNSQFLSQSQGLVNQLLSLSVGMNATVEGMQMQILALRSSMPENSVAPSLRGQEVDTKA